MIDMHIVFIDWFYSCPQAGRREVGTGARMCTRAWELNSTPTNKMLQLTHLKMHLDIVSLYNLGNWHVTWVFMVTEYIYRTVPFMIMQENGITTDEFLFSLSFSFFTAASDAGRWGQRGGGCQERGLHPSKHLKGYERKVHKKKSKTYWRVLGLKSKSEKREGAAMRSLHLQHWIGFRFLPLFTRFPWLLARREEIPLQKAQSMLARKNT